MKVLLALPCNRSYPVHGEFYPIGTAYLASYLRSRGHAVRVVHQLYPQKPSDDVLVDLAKTSDAVGLSTNTANIDRVFAVAGRIKKEAGAGKPIILGGPMVSGWPDLVLRPEADYAVLGEGERVTADLLDCIENGGSPEKIPGLAFGREKLVLTGPGPRIKDLDALPFPDFSELPLSGYHLPFFTTVLGTRVDRLTMMITSRGCPYACVFCMAEASWQNRWIARSVPNVMQELERRSKEGKTSVAFMDLDINIERKRAADLYEAMIAAPFKFKWVTETSPLSVDEELLALMRKSGCAALLFGIESQPPDQSEYVGKKYDWTRFSELTRHLSKLGIMCFCHCIIGLPWENRETHKTMIRNLKTVSADVVNFAYVDPYPGTQVWRLALREGWIPKSWEIFDRPLTSPALPTHHLSKEELAGLQVRMSLQYYFSVHFIFHMTRKFLRRPVDTIRLLLGIFSNALKAIPHKRSRGLPAMSAPATESR